MNVLKRHLTKLLYEFTQNPFLQFFRYVFVGGSAFCVDAGTLFLLQRAGVHYLLAAAAAFLLGLVVNFLLSKRFVFTENSEKVGLRGEFLAYGLIGLAGLALTELLMYVLTDIAGFYFMFSKAMSAAVVLIWNFTARKLLLYR